MAATGDGARGFCEQVPITTFDTDQRVGELYVHVLADGGFALGITLRSGGHFGLTGVSSDTVMNLATQLERALNHSSADIPF